MLGSNERSNCPDVRLATSVTSIVASNAPDTTSEALTVTGTPMVTSQSFQIADIPSPYVSRLKSFPLDMSRTLVSPDVPISSKWIVASDPDPFTTVAPGRCKSTRTLPSSIKRHMSTGTSVPAILPESTLVTFTTLGSNERSNCPAARLVTSVTSIVASNAPDTTSGALTQTCVFCAIVSIMSASSELIRPSPLTSARLISGAMLPTDI